MNLELEQQRAAAGRDRRSTQVELAAEQQINSHLPPTRRTVEKTELKKKKKKTKKDVCCFASLRRSAADTRSRRETGHFTRSRGHSAKLTHCNANSYYAAVIGGSLDAYYGRGSWYEGLWAASTRSSGTHTNAAQRGLKPACTFRHGLFRARARQKQQLELIIIINEKNVMETRLKYSQEKVPL